MLLAPVRYLRPASLPEALIALEREAGARVLAGGQSLLNVLKLRAATVELLVDISRLEELRGVTVAGGSGELVVGAGTRYDEVAASETVRSAQPALAMVCAHLVDRQVRARGTVGGNCCFNDPLSNLPPLFVALDARFRIAGRRGLREVAADDFFLAPFQTAVAQDEILQSVVVPAPAPGASVSYRSLQVATDSWAIARAVVQIVGDPIARARVVVGCVGPRPLRQHAIEEALVGRARAAVDPVALGALACPETDAFDDVHASGGYRIEMSRVTVTQALHEVIGEEPQWSTS